MSATNDEGAPRQDTPSDDGPRRVVVKVGTSVLTGGTRRLDRARMLEIVRQCAGLHDDGREVVLCTSGAIAAGRERLGFDEIPRALTGKQMLAAVGQSRLVEIWEQLFDIYGIHVGQVLLTRSDVEDRHRFLNARDTLNALLEERIVPVVNENDAVATAEIKVGDNDNLSALCVLLTGADLLVLLTDQPGLFTGDPRHDPDAELIREVTEIDGAVRRAAGASRTDLGTGGMETKVEAARTARRAGADVVIAGGEAPDVIRRIVAGEPVGTRFPAAGSEVEGRKRWILGGAPAAGRIEVDGGAAEALLEDGGSLLPVGIVGLEGSFDRGDAVRVVGPDGREVGRGIARYAREEVERIMGERSERIPGILGYDGGAVVVHRDDLILV